MQKAIITLGCIVLLIGLCWPWIKKIGLGRLPGDIAMSKGSFSFYFPIMTCLLISLILSIALSLLKR